jgi:hypothetical protein
MGLKTKEDYGDLKYSYAVECIEYAIQQKLDYSQNVVAINASWGSYPDGMDDDSGLLNIVIEEAGNAGIVFCAAAGNGGSDTDIQCHIPSCYSLSNIISVAETDHNDTKTYNSSYGATSVDLGAPGKNILSTVLSTRANIYNYGNGTSMAAAHVTGAVALIAAEYRIGRILSNVDPNSSLADKCVTGGRLNVYNAIKHEESPSITVTSPHSGDTWNVGSTYAITWTKTGTMDSNVKISLRDSTSTTKILDIINSTLNDGNYSWEIPTSVAPGNYVIRVSTTDSQVYGDSEAFTINTPSAPYTITITNPTGGEIYDIGNTIPITWTTTGSGDWQVRVYLCRPGITIKTIGDFPHGQNSVNYTIPGDIGQANDYFIKIKKLDDSQIYSNSNNFTINTPLQTLIIQSAPVFGVPITVSPDDINGDGDGNTDFMRIYNEGIMITLTAPDIYNGRDFIKWIIDGTADNYSRTIQINMGEGHTVEAVYKTLQTLFIQSAPVFGVPVTVSPDDINGDADGNTDFMRIYNEGIMIALTAPEVCNDRDFVRWIIDGTDNDSRTIQVNMDNYHMADAIYETDGYEDAGTSVVQTSDGGYIIAGYSNAYTHGAYDFLVYKLDSNGKTQSRRFLGGTDDEQAYDVKQTSDQGYIVVGSTTSFTHGNSDILVYKMDANGNKQWRKNFGGVQAEEGFSIHQTSDGGYILAGYTYSFTHGEGDSDFVVYKLDGNGNKQWRKNFGGINEDKAYSIVQTSDGGYIVSGQTKSFVHGVEDTDLLVYKLSSNGSKQWRKNYGGELDEEGGMIQKTSDGGYIVAGYSDSFTNGDSDFIVYKLDGNGNKQWRKNFGGTNEDTCFSVKQTTDGGYILAGCTYSFTHGDYDFLVYKIDSNGNKQWRKNYGGIDEDRAFSIIQTSDGGYMIVGDTSSFVHTPGYKDFLLYKIDANGNKVWRKNLGI